jgi:hypothetical protein
MAGKRRDALEQAIEQALAPGAFIDYRSNYYRWAPPSQTYDHLMNLLPKVDRRFWRCEDIGAAERVIPAAVLW